MKPLIVILVFAFSSSFCFSQDNSKSPLSIPYKSTPKVVSYIGLNLGTARPMGEFGNLDINNTKAGLAGGGISLSLVNFGMYWGKFGFNVRWFGNAHPMKNGVSKQIWSYGSLMVGPTYTLDLFKNAYLDIKPSIGAMSSQILLGNDKVKDGTGFGLGLGTQFRYNFARKWSLTANLDYTTTSQTMKSVGTGTGADYKQSIAAISTNLGAIYYFKAPMYK